MAEMVAVYNDFVRLSIQVIVMAPTHPRVQNDLVRLSIQVIVTAPTHPRVHNDLFRLSIRAIDTTSRPWALSTLKLSNCTR
jgi:hypothetical protein